MQIIGAVIKQGQLAALLRAVQLCTRSEKLPRHALQIGKLPVARRFFRFLLRLYRLRADALQLAHRPALLHREIRQLYLPLAVHARQRARMSRGQFSIDHHLLNHVLQREQAQQVRQRAAALAQPFGGALLRKAALLHQAAHAARFFNGVQIIALQIFNQSRFQLALLIPVAHDGGNHFQPRHAARAIAALARDDAIAAVRFTHHDGLNHAHRFNRGRQFSQRILVKRAARLIGIRIDHVNRQIAHRVHGRGILHRYCLRLYFRLQRDHIFAQQRAQSAPQAALNFLCHDQTPSLCISSSARFAYAFAPMQRASYAPIGIP